MSTVIYILDDLSAEETKKLTDFTRDIPMDAFCDNIFGKNNWLHDKERDLWITKNPHHEGEGFGYIAVRQDKTWFTGVMPHPPRAV